MTCTAYCSRDGVIGIADGLHFPDACLPIATGSRGHLSFQIEELAERTRKGRAWRVPGVTGRERDHVAYTAVQTFAATILTRNASLRRWPITINHKGTRS
ncbi:hypothetical protein CFR78_04345 [Komagataeibacter rhaeticus]|uniref:hypothetical protein n=1 Tax=Komagataeibacter rhaeticus TaxID=215221 RepID=UPI0004D706E3|nr:hypothetical protein [Komagataeibacter rhaeticus]KDU96478.1 hypothetical protein GLUCORHAEAF1_01820 [Komagataeibacter rhaeticus AF1]PYD54205.1 hypothetical protein CFR78_04345 [Komagataeibacter rhaeticus]GBQ15178.1 hypothetical protein AA16663_2011 [Komagataeibacter rhaeticus DSM 16663]